MKKVDTLIVGAGVSGASQLYLLAKYTNIKDIMLIEKENSAGLINSNSKNNSQTLHEGDIETNYNYEKAQKVKHAASFTKNYVLSKSDPKLRMISEKMVLGVGDYEVDFLEKRFKEFKNLFPDLKLLREKELQKIEPYIFKGRKKSEKVAGLYSEKGLTIDYGLLAKSLIKDSINEREKNIVVEFGTSLKSVKKNKENEYIISTNKGETIFAKTLVFATGAHSLMYAKKLGYGKHLSLLLVAGNFYYTPKYIKTKIYTIQNDKLPFSAVHGDPDITLPNKTRFGPTTNIVFTLERNRFKTIKDYFKSIKFNFKMLKSKYKILSDKDFFWYALKHNITFQLPIIGIREFVKEARKIIPSLKFSDMKLAKGQGGVRPQIVDTTDKDKPLKLGEARLEGENVLFNITPSPGASISIYNAYQDTFRIINFLGEGYRFNEKEFLKDFNK